jgi:arginine deiminase
LNISKLVSVFEEEVWREFLDKLPLVIRPPTIRLKYEEVFKGYPDIPPQPYEEIINVADVKNKVGIPDLDIFFFFDQIIGLLPNSLYRKLINEGWQEPHYKFISQLVDLWKTIDLSRERFYPEDHPKTRIMMISPSDKQFSIVRGSWLEWVWREYTRNGEVTPYASGWVRDVYSISEALSDYNVSIDLFLDQELENLVDEPPKNVKTHYIDIPPDLPKIGYTRDQSVTWMERPIIGNMALDIRKGEERVINEVYHMINYRPILRASWSRRKNILVRSKMEGGNFFLIKTEKGIALFTGIGVRGSNISTFKFLADFLPDEVELYGVPLSGYVKHWDITGSVHLDVVFTYLGDLNGTYYAVIDPMRIGMYSILRYDRVNEAFEVEHFGVVAKKYGIVLDEAPRRGGSPITMANALNLGRGRIVVDSFNKEMNKYLEMEFNVDVIEVDIPHIEAGGGGVRCATRELY